MPLGSEAVEPEALALGWQGLAPGLMPVFDRLAQGRPAGGHEGAHVAVEAEGGANLGFEELPEFGSRALAHRQNRAGGERFPTVLSDLALEQFLLHLGREAGPHLHAVGERVDLLDRFIEQRLVPLR